MKKKCPQNCNPPPKDPSPNSLALWANLKDSEKQASLLGSTRLVDDEIFRDRFGSWEAPELDWTPQEGGAT